MAVIQYSGLVNQMRGKLNGSTLSRNRSTNTIYRKGQPAGTSTVLQDRRRSAFAQVQRSWKTLTNQQKSDYSQASDSNPTTDRFGNPTILSGYAYYMKINIPVYVAFGSVFRDINTAPALPLPANTVSEPDVIITTTPAPRSLNMTWVQSWPSGIPADVYILIYFSKPMPPGQTKYHGRWIFTGTAETPRQGFQVYGMPMVDYGFEPRVGDTIFARADFFRMNEGVRILRIEAQHQFYV